MYNERRERIRALLFEKSFVSLRELKSLFPDVSDMTLRRDIEYFEKSGEAVKVRGGARSMKFVTDSTDDAITTRMHEHTASKSRIARRAADFLETGRSIFIDSGSTLQSIVPYVPNNRFTFTTTNPLIAMELCKIGLPAVNMVGGKLDRDYQTVTGMHAMRFLSDVNIDIALLSPSGFALRSGFTGGNFNESELKRIVVEKARLVVMLMDASKIDKSLPYTFCHLQQVHVLITDVSLPEPMQEEAVRCGTTVINVSQNTNEKTPALPDLI